ncbi:Rv3654c family TadE-like protein [Nocardia sp. R6R-6]|uniref:Rv3654c family TadE-like protein n=1 Tax=Nocardia sp. R6R-6 TaxID=3459303 RepID=UPI00403D87A8
MSRTDSRSGYDGVDVTGRRTWRGFVAADLRTSGEHGVATVFACSGLVALISVTLLIAQVGAVVVARHRAQAAADMAALAAASALVQGVNVACAEAGEVARRMGTRIRDCTAAEWDVSVTVEANVPIGLYRDRSVRAIARAGPAEA